MKHQKRLAELDTLGWSGAELARRTGYSDDAISRYRTGRRPIPKLIEAYLVLAALLHEKGFRVP